MGKPTNTERDMMIDLTKEKSLCTPVSRYIRRRGFAIQKEELAFYNRSVDIYGFSVKTNLTIAVELKLTKWRKALTQAMIYQLCADHTYIAMPQKATVRVDRKLLEQYGIGLISVDERGRCRRVVDARQSHVLQSEYKCDYIQSLCGENNEQRAAADSSTR